RNRSAGTRQADRPPRRRLARRGQLSRHFGLSSRRALEEPLRVIGAARRPTGFPWRQWHHLSRSQGIQLARAAIRDRVAIQPREHHHVAVRLARSATRHPTMVRRAGAAWRTSMRLPRVAVVSDLREERWYAMDLVAEMLVFNLLSRQHPLVDA